MSDAAAPRVRPIVADVEFTEAEMRTIARHQVLHSAALNSMMLYGAVALFFTVVAAIDVRNGDAHAVIEGAIALALVLLVCTTIPLHARRSWNAYRKAQPVSFAFSEEGFVVSIPGVRTTYVAWASVPAFVVVPEAGYVLSLSPNPTLVGRRSIPADRLTDFEELLARKVRRRTRHGA